MRPGSVVVDLAAEQGGNCELTEPGSDVVRHGVTICGPLNVPSLIPLDASRMFSHNVIALLGHLIRDDAFIALEEDEVARPCLVAHGGRVWSGGEIVSGDLPGGEA